MEVNWHKLHITSVQSWITLSLQNIAYGIAAAAMADGSRQCFCFLFGNKE
jgi:hypothetical protein